jgi:uncharacterized membrane protein (DUF485 family)
MTMAANQNTARSTPLDSPALSPELARIAASPAFQQLRSQRNALAIRLTIAMCAIYFGFILLIAFGKEILATKLDEVITLGLPLGLAVILSAIVLTGIYVSKANREFDRLTADATRAAKSHTAS